jgi:hypothetical protein
MAEPTLEFLVHRKHMFLVAEVVLHGYVFEDVRWRVFVLGFLQETNHSEHILEECSAFANQAVPSRRVLLTRPTGYYQVLFLDSG